MEIFTLGHSTSPLEYVVSLMQGYGTRLVDIRTIPRSLHNPQFNKDVMAEMLPIAGLGYTHMPGLGGLRPARKDSINGGWTNSGFRGFADYMQTSEFERNLGKLIERAKKEPVAIMCSEAVPWRCHRSLVADALTVRGISVYHIMSRVSAYLHKVTPWAKVTRTSITYPAHAI